MSWKELIANRADRGVHLDENGRIVMWENQAMSDVIKPEDVTQDVIDAVVKKIGLKPIAWDCPKPENLIAAILNAAIDAGLVSPPVYVVRDLETGKLEKFAGDIMLTLDPEPEPMVTLYRKETWKGEE